MQNKSLFALLALSMFLWGAAWPSSKILVGYTSIYIVSFWRLLFVTIGSFFVLKLFKIPLKLHKHNIKWIILAGILNGLYSLFFFIALNHGAAGKGGVLVTTMVPVCSYIILIVSIIYAREEKLSNKISKGEIIGLLLGLCSGLFLLDLGSIDEIFGKFNVLFLLCAFIWALLTFITHKIKDQNPFSINFYLNLISLCMFSWVLTDNNTLGVLHMDHIFWINMIVITFLSNIIGTSLYYYGIRKLGNTKASTFMLIVPVSALLCSYILLHEIPSLYTLIGCALAICAIYFINKHKK